MDRRTVLAFVLISLVILYMSTDHYKRLAGIPLEGELEAVPQQIDENREAPDPSPEGRLETLAETRGDPEETRSVTQEELSAEVPVSTLPFAASRGVSREIRVETDQYIAWFTTKGASLSRLEMKGFKSYYDEHIVLFENGGGNLSPSFNLDGLLVDGSELTYESKAGDTIRLTGEESRELQFVYEDAGGRFIEKTYTLQGGSYGMELDLAVGGLKERLRNAGYTIGWDTPLQVTELDTLQDATYAEVVLSLGSEVQNFSSGMKEDTANETRNGSLNWITVRNKYFGVSVVPRGRPGNQVALAGTTEMAGSGKPIKSFGWEMELPLASSDGIRDRYTLYLGPLHSDYMHSVEPELEKAIMTRTSLGMMGFMWPVIRPFADLIRVVFNFLHGFIANYGIVIIVFSVLVKIVVFPLTHKSYKSMKEMQRIKPLMDEVRAKYKDNPKKMQEETMALYREHKVNPLGSCLPMLLQMPLFFALFFVFRSAFDLRGASFVWWINDLSVPDAIFHLPFTIPLYGNTVGLLPILMAISSYLMTRMTSSGEPAQQMMMKTMPFVMLVLFNNFPSGLTLYYTLFNLLSALQQHYSKGMLDSTPIQPKPVPAKASSGKGGGKRRKPRRAS